MHDGKCDCIHGQSIKACLPIAASSTSHWPCSDFKRDNNPWLNASRKANIRREVLRVRGSNVRAGSTQGQAVPVGLPGGGQGQAPDQDQRDSTTVDFKVMLRKGAKSRSVQVYKTSPKDRPLIDIIVSFCTSPQDTVACRWQSCPGKAIFEVIHILLGLVRDVWPMQFGTYPTANLRR